MTANREALVEGYCDMVNEYIAANFEPTMLSFMFKELGGTKSSRTEQMTLAVEEVYSKALSRTLRRSNRTLCRENPRLRPFWLMCMDWPVPKGVGSNRDHLANIVLNDGQHVQGIALTPPYARFRCPLKIHFDEKSSVYAPKHGIIDRIHAMPITETPSKAVRYLLKSITRQRIELGDVILLPKALSEIQR